MNKWLASLVCLLFSPLLLAAQPCLSMHVVLNDSSGYIDGNGKASGYHVDFLTALQEKTGLCMEQKLLPYSRALKSIDYGEHDGGIIARADGPDANVVYITKLITSRTVVIPRKGLSLSSYQDLAQITVGRFRGVDLNNTLARNTHIDMVDLLSYHHGLRMLQKGRIDALVGNEFGLSILDSQELLTTVNFPGKLVIGEREVWLVLSKKSQHLDKVEQLKSAAQALIDQGVLDNILKKYFKIDG